MAVDARRPSARSLKVTKRPSLRFLRWPPPTKTQPSDRPANPPCGNVARVACTAVSSRERVHFTGCDHGREGGECSAALRPVARLTDGRSSSCTVRGRRRSRIGTRRASCSSGSVAVVRGPAPVSVSPPQLMQHWHSTEHNAQPLRLFRCTESRLLLHLLLLLRAGGVKKLRLPPPFTPFYLSDLSLWIFNGPFVCLQRPLMNCAVCFCALMMNIWPSLVTDEPFNLDTAKLSAFSMRIDSIINITDEGD